MFDIFVQLIGRDPSTLVTHSEVVVCLSCCVLIVLGLLFFYRCLDRIFLR